MPKPKAKATKRQTAPKVPGRQLGDPKPEIGKPEAKPVLQDFDAGRAELAAYPARTSVLTKKGHLVRE